jgi:hypothetical protein
MIQRLARFVGAAYRPSIMVPYMVSWAVGLTALFACVTGAVHRWRPDGALLITMVTLVVDMMLMRALDDIRDLDYDREYNPGRPLPSGMVRERDLLTMVGVGAALLLLLNAGRGVVVVMLAVQLAYAATVIALDRVARWPNPDRLALPLVVNLPIQTLLSLYVYAGFLRAENLKPSVAGLLAVLAVTIAALCMEFGRKATRRPRPGERTYVTVLGPSGTSLAALASAVVATGIVLATLAPWNTGAGWGWLVLAPLAIPALAVVKFAAGAVRWPLGLTLGYIPVMYGSFLAVGWLSKGVFG